jgi:short-subunit dehydrogenase
MERTLYLITGASRGIGFECAKQLLERTDRTVMITARGEAGLNSARESLGPALAARLRVHVCDQAQLADLESLLAAIDAAEEPVEGAVLGVGFNPTHAEGPRRLQALSLDTIRETVTTNCTHTAWLTARLLERLPGHPGACLIWIGSHAASRAPLGNGIYAASKSFLSGLARTADHEYRGRGVRVHLLHPGITRTPRTEAFAAAYATRHGEPIAEAGDVAARIVDVLLHPGFREVEVML